MNISPAVWIPAATGLLGVLIGALIGPVLARYLAKRDRTISVKVFDRNPPTLIAPHRAVKILWDDEPIDKIYQIGFEMTNVSKTKLRNFSLEIEVDNGDDDSFEVALEDHSRARWTEVACDRIGEDGREIAAVFRFEFIESGETIRGTVITDAPGKVRFISSDEVEIDTRYDSQDRSRNIWVHAASVGSALTAGAAITALFSKV